MDVRTESSSLAGKRLAPARDYTVLIADYSAEYSYGSELEASCMQVLIQLCLCAHVHLARPIVVHMCNKSYNFMQV